MSSRRTGAMPVSSTQSWSDVPKSLMRSRCDRRSISRAAWTESSDETQGDRDGRRGEKSPRSEEEHCREDQPQGEESPAEDGVPFAGKAAERQERERVVRARRRPDARFGQHEKRGNPGHRDGHGDDGGARARARDPQAETEHERRKGGDHVPLADVVEILDGEERDLGDEQNDVGSRHREERTCGRSPPRRAPSPERRASWSRAAADRASSRRRRRHAT